jgi:dimethylaniline monooxygenase (N-oxide forming)
MGDKVCIIGAGATGIVAAKILKEHAIPFDCFEMGSDIGGNWRYDNDNGRSAAYDSLHIDTSKDRMQFSDFPMPDDYPIFPHHSQILAYFQAYAAHFGIRPFITFRTQVTHVAPVEQGGYRVTTRNLDTEQTTTGHYRAVLVCNGHHWQPHLPNFPGDFNSPTRHSRSYRNPRGLEGKNVLIVGIGNSGVDIACEAADVARRVYLSTRRGAHILPRFVFGRPIDKWVTPLSARLPAPVQAFFLNLMIRLDRGDQQKFGIPRPAHPLYAAHGTVSAELPHKVAAGQVIMKPNVQTLAGAQVRFADGSLEDVDEIIYATGYQIAFPFLAADLLSVQDNHIPLYRKAAHPDLPGLYFIGLIQPLGPIMPLAELQVRWVAGLLSGKMGLPDKTTMQRAIAEDQARLNGRYLNTPRHTIQVDFFPYKRELEQEMRRGPLYLPRSRP